MRVYVCLHWFRNSAFINRAFEQNLQRKCSIDIFVDSSKGERNRERAKEKGKKTHENETKRNETEWEMPVSNVTLNSFNKILHGIDSDIYG